ncbi:MAG: DUF5011 domain-containing protein [Mollicutes bacterium]|nr:DUF5011 domain-containing protein [Mollicutes bacterium]
MKNMSIERAKRIRSLIASSALIAILLMISTYAWFIGMRTVNVSSFDVQIASTESLLLSLDGVYWDTTVEISKDILDEVSYEGHTNSWGGKGLIPLSTIGEMDSSTSRLKLYEKTSFRPTAGGYRLMTSLVDNSGPNEKDGYVVFDLFIKNKSGSKYIKELNPLDEEAVYLADDSFVDVAVGGVAGTGIENSVRVAFAQVGRVDANQASPEDIIGITCQDTEVVTGICRDASIWEPNDTSHVENAIKWYNKSCKKRIGQDIYDPSSYGESCEPLTDGVYYPTYAVADEIHSDDYVDIYDGEEFNGYTNSTKLKKFDYFTDTDKMKSGTDREALFTLAPNSVTKMRIYIYIEGQDIDNYEYAAIGRKIEVKFGFTKERFTEDDIDYDGPDIDTEPPVITLNGDNPMYVPLGAEFVDPGAKARDNMDADITEKIHVSGNVNTNEVGTYEIIYEVSDRAGNQTIVTRTVIVE